MVLQYFFPPSWCQIRKHVCTRQPHYMLFGCLMRAGQKMENVPSVVCLMAGFLSSHHTAGVPGWSRQHPSAGHCRDKTQFFNLQYHHYHHHLSLLWLHRCCITSKCPWGLSRLPVKGLDTPTGTNIHFFNIFKSYYVLRGANICTIVIVILW